MKDIKTARLLYQKAGNDFTAIQNMTNVSLFSDDIFGFHAQQSVEKLLKALLALRGILYPKTHDIYPLLRRLESTGENTSDFDDLVELNMYAVQARYDDYHETDEPLNRIEWIQKIQNLLLHVEIRLNATLDE